MAAAQAGSGALGEQEAVAGVFTAHIANTFDAIDADGSAEVSFAEFKRWFQARQQERQEEERRRRKAAGRQAVQASAAALAQEQTAAAAAAAAAVEETRRKLLGADPASLWDAFDEAGAVVEAQPGPSLGTDGDAVGTDADGDAVGTEPEPGPGSGPEPYDGTAATMREVVEKAALDNE
eukprot:SAG22_NODE_106_length_19904_cov_14.387175_7_plen_179_part_00